MLLEETLSAAGAGGAAQGRESLEPQQGTQGKSEITKCKSEVTQGKSVIPQGKTWSFRVKVEVPQGRSVGTQGESEVTKCKSVVLQGKRGHSG